MLINRARPASVALETTLLLHGVPRGQGEPLAYELARIVQDRGAHPLLVGVVAGRPTVGLTNEELTALLAADGVPKANSSNLGVFIARGRHAATTVSTTMELAAAAGVQVFATGGLGGVHRGYGEHLDISADLAAFTRFPVAVVTSGVKSILDVEATREALETLGVPVIGWQTDRFPAFYLRESAAGVDARFDDIGELAAYVRHELARTGRGIVVCNPIPAASELPRADWDRWLAEAINEAERAGIAGRETTPFLLAHLHGASGGATLRANLDLVRSNAALAAELARRLAPGVTA
ncbi:MAG TPA: pseudouridine-5'-phosphate glycosidase [Phycisphaerales bacterium]|nr:pseudouridine-5'-phosphate glycosidase [Phycisphaerales bacterium]